MEQLYQCESGKRNNDICANCGGRRGLHNHMNQRCPKDINSDGDHTEYRDTVFAEPLPQLEDKEWIDREGKKYGLVQETGIEVKFYFETINTNQ